jgi:DNA polymerase V
MKCFDTINDKYGRGTICMGASGMSGGEGSSGGVPWKMKREFLSPEYTTRLEDVPKVL